MENRIAGRFFRIVVCSSMLFFSAFAFGQKLNAPGNSQLSPEINVDTIPAKLKRNSSNTLAADPNGWSGFYIGKKCFYILPFYQKER
jgi:hypothetical protein